MSYSLRSLLRKWYMRTPERQAASYNSPARLRHKSRLGITRLEARVNPGYTGCIGDFVWEDLNCNGVQEVGESGVAGVQVNLLNSGGAQIQTTTTNSNGLYSFKGLSAGNYTVEFKPVAGWKFSPANKGGNSKLDSNVTDPATGRTSVITLGYGQVDSSIDAGLCKPVTAALGDFVWSDLNANGLQDNGEPGVAGVTVNLLDGLGGFIATTKTNGSGIYGFTDLNPGDYIVEFKLPANSMFTTANVGANDAIDSDANTATGRTAIVTLAAGDDNLTIDAGLVKKPEVIKGRLGDYVWFDINSNGLQDAGEPGVGNITVQLLDAAGTTVIDTTTTDGNGLYLFDNLDAGNYRVKFIKNLATDAFSPQHVGNDPKIDSDPDPLTGITSVIALAQGETNLTIDAGLIKPPPPPKPSSIRGIVYCDENENGVYDNGDHGLGAVRIILAGHDNTGQFITRDTYSGADGTWEFTGLTNGMYQLNEVQPAGLQQGTNKAGTAGGIVVQDAIAAIPLGKGVDAYDYMFGEICPDIEPNKNHLLASSSGDPAALINLSKNLPSSPTYANSVAVTKLSGPSIIRYAATGQGTGGSRVRVFDYTQGKNRFEFDAYPGFMGGVRVAVADVTGDAVPDIITAPGAGGGPHIKVYSGATGQVVSEFYAYDASFASGVYVAAGDVDGNGVAEIITAAGEGGGPHVKVFSGSGAVQRQFFAYAPNMNSGVRVAVGDFNGDARTDIITAPGAGSGPHIKVFSGNPNQGVLDEFFAYGGGFAGGVYVAAGDVDGDGLADIVTGPGAGGGPHVKVFKGGSHDSVLDEFFAYEASFLGGVRVGALDTNGDGKADVLTAPASGFPSMVQIRDLSIDVNGLRRNSFMEAFLAYDHSYMGGAFVAGGTNRNLPEALDS